MDECSFTMAGMLVSVSLLIALMLRRSTGLGTAGFNGGTRRIYYLPPSDLRLGHLFSSLHAPQMRSLPSLAMLCLLHNMPRPILFGLAAAALSLLALAERHADKIKKAASEEVTFFTRICKTGELNSR